MTVGDDTDFHTLFALCSLSLLGKNKAQSVYSLIG